MKVFKAILEVLNAFLVMTIIVVSCYYYGKWIVIAVIVYIIISMLYSYLKDWRKKHPKMKIKKQMKVINIGTYKVKRMNFIIACVVFFLFVFNPSLRDFKDFKGGDSYARRTGYFVILSIYQDYNDRVYLGICKNFIFIKHL